MSSEHSDSLLMHIVRMMEEMDNVSLRISNERVFRSQSLPKPKLAPAELGFILTVSWLYVLYLEAGKVSIKFLQSLLQRAYRLDPDNHVEIHLDTIKAIRTYLQHNLDLNVHRGRETQEICEKWLEKQCNTRLPMTEHQWEKCLIALLDEALECMTLLKNCIREIEQDESREDIITFWNLRRSRYHPKEDFDPLITLVAADFGQTNFNVLHLRNHYYQRWTDQLAMIEGDYDFPFEARKLIEYSILSETAKKLPITGKDVMEEFHIPPGQRLQEIMLKAKSLYDREPSSRDSLLEKLRREI